MLFIHFVLFSFDVLCQFLTRWTKVYDSFWHVLFFPIEFILAINKRRPCSLFWLFLELSDRWMQYLENLLQPRRSCLTITQKLVFFFLLTCTMQIISSDCIWWHALITWYFHFDLYCIYMQMWSLSSAQLVRYKCILADCLSSCQSFECTAFFCPCRYRGLPIILWLPALCEQCPGLYQGTKQMVL